MKLLLERDDGIKIEVSEINTIDDNCEVLFFFLRTTLREVEIKELENVLKFKTGKQCVVLNGYFADKIVGV